MLSTWLNLAVVLRFIVKWTEPLWNDIDNDDDNDDKDDNSSDGD